MGLPIGFAIMAWHFLAHGIYELFGAPQEDTPAAVPATTGGES
jgi:hypothetical protein